MTGVPEGAPGHAVIVRAHQLLAEAPSAIVTATVDDALAVEERPNMPRTTTQWPTGALALPASLEELEPQGGARAVAATLARRRAP